MAVLPSSFFALFLIFTLAIFTVEFSSAARKPKPRAKEDTTTEGVLQRLPLKELDTARRIYHSQRTNDRCECGAFKTAKKSNETPLYYQIATRNYHCDEQQCKKLCLSLPAFDTTRGIEILCAHLNQADGLKPVVHYKNCNDNWMYAGLPTKETICCAKGKRVTCA